MLPQSEDKREREPKTVALALNSLGRIRAIEDPFLFGLRALYKVKHNGYDTLKECKNIIFIKRLFNVNKYLIDIIDLEDKSVESIKSWSIIRNEEFGISKIKLLVGLYNTFKNENDRIQLRNELVEINNILNNILSHNYNNMNIDKVIMDIDKAITDVEIISDNIRKKLESEKKTSTKIISSSLPIV